MYARSKTRAFKLPTPEEDVRIRAGIAADPDAYELTDEQMKELEPRGVGRPRAAVPRPTLTMRIDADILEAFKATGPGWQTRIHAILRKAVDRGGVK